MIDLINTIDIINMIDAVNVIYESETVNAEYSSQEKICVCRIWDDVCSLNLLWSLHDCFLSQPLRYTP